MKQNKKFKFDMCDIFINNEIIKENDELLSEIKLMVAILDSHKIKVPEKIRKRLEKDEELPFD